MVTTQEEKEFGIVDETSGIAFCDNLQDVNSLEQDMHRYVRDMHGLPYVLETKLKAGEIEELFKVTKHSAYVVTALVFKDIECKKRYLEKVAIRDNEYLHRDLSSEQSLFVNPLKR